MVAHLFSLGFIAVIGYFTRPGSSLFSWHPFLMTLAYVGFIFQAILVFSPESSLFVTWRHKNKIRMHWFLCVAGLVAALNAFAAIYYTKEENEKPHFATWHGCIGVLTLCYTCAQVFGGHFLTVLNPLFRPFLPTYSNLSLYHATSGTLHFVLVCCSLSLGIFSNWFTKTTPFYIWYLAFAICALLGLIVANQVTAKYVIARRGGAATAAEQQAAAVAHVMKSEAGKAVNGKNGKTAKSRKA